MIAKLSKAIILSEILDQSNLYVAAGENEVSLVSLNGESSDPECSDREISDFVSPVSLPLCPSNLSCCLSLIYEMSEFCSQASWLGGSYVEDASGSLNGELILPMADGAFLRLHMSEVLNIQKFQCCDLFQLIMIGSFISEKVLKDFIFNSTES